MLAVQQPAAKHRSRDVTSGRALRAAEVLCQQCDDTNGPVDRHFEAGAGTSGTSRRSRLLSLALSADKAHGHVTRGNDNLT
jgi:hypothetical protein